MHREIILKLNLCDRNRNFYEIVEGIKKLIGERDGVDNLEVIEFNKLHLDKENHKIGVELETYTNVLFYRGFKKEHDMLMEVASRLK